MKILYVGMMIGDDGYEDKKFGSDFLFLSYSIGHYLARTARENNYISEYYNRVVVVAKTGDIHPAVIEEKFLKIEIPFDRHRYERSTKEDLPEFFSEMYRTAFKKVHNKLPLPYDLFIHALNDLRDNEYRNEWVFQSKTFREPGIRAVLSCVMNMDFFSMKISVYQKEELFFEKEIVHTPPDEIFFHRLVKEMVFVKNQIVIFDSCKEKYATINWPSLKIRILKTSEYNTPKIE